jgi:hypothetical protein
MKEATQQSDVRTPQTNPMNLTCAPVQGGAAPADGQVQYAIVLNANGPAQPPDSTWTPLPGFDAGSIAYVVSGKDFHGNSGHADLDGTGIGVYTKTV